MDDLENKNQNTDNQNEKDPISKPAVIGFIIFMVLLIGVIPLCYFLGLFNFKPDPPLTMTPTPRGIVAIEDAEIGDTVIFGQYDQNNDSEDGGEDIEWIVLDIQDDHYLLITKLGIECRPYHSVQKAITWKDCGLRSWLNYEFYDWFTDYEKKHILKTEIEPASNPEYETDPGEATTDRLFILSLEEVMKYFPTEESRKLEITTSAIAHGAYYTFTNNKNYGWWWVRNPGNFQDNAVYIHRNGRIFIQGDYVYSRESCVRPVLWYSLPEIVEETPAPSAEN